MLDLVGLGLIAPYVTFVLQPASKFDENLIKTALSLNPEVSTDTLLLWLSIAIVTIFIFKAISVIFINNMIIGFSQDQQIKIRSQLMKNIQNLPYCEFIKRNSAEYIHSVEVLAGQFQSVLSLLLKSLSDFMVVSLFYFC